MAIGQVTATSLNLRGGPNGTVLGFLVKGTAVDILGSDGKWLRVSTLEQPPRIGWVSGKFVAQGAPSSPLQPSPLVPQPSAAIPSSVPPAEDATHKVTVVGKKAIGPDGHAFATRSKGGFFTLGKTSLRAWLDAGSFPPVASASIVRVVRAVSLNEGRLEAINSYDNAFLSTGIFQWTAGSGGDPGELAGLLDIVRQNEPDAFEEYFGRHDLGVSMSSGGGQLATGFLTLAGKRLGASEKEQLRSAEWAYRFWRAGHDDKIRMSQLRCAASRIAIFLKLPAKGHPISAWLRSEEGIALVLDQHVNRPGHVPDTLEVAIGRLGGSPDPAGWSTAEEARLIDLYCEEREKTTMTDAAKRAGRIADCVLDGTLSDQRGSFSTS